MYLTVLHCKPWHDEKPLVQCDFHYKVVYSVKSCIQPTTIKVHIINKDPLPLFVVYSLAKRSKLYSQQSVVENLVSNQALCSQKKTTLSLNHQNGY